jgi:hypothetical protein
MGSHEGDYEEHNLLGRNAVWNSFLSYLGNFSHYVTCRRFGCDAICNSFLSYVGNFSHYVTCRR